MTDASEVVIVAGTDYLKYERGAGQTYTLHPFSHAQWREVANRRAAEELRAPGTRVTIFDFASGAVETTERGKRTTRTAQFRQPANSEWRRYVFDGQQLVLRKPTPTAKDNPRTAFFAGSTAMPQDVPLETWRKAPLSQPPMSMLDVYKYVSDIGMRRPGTLRALHVFSHSYSGGPILLDTNDWDPLNNARDPTDTDARRRKDFNDTNLPSILASRTTPVAPPIREFFVAAWRPPARVVIWGCLQDHFVDRLITVAAPRITAKPDLSVKVRFVYTTKSDWADRELESWQGYFQADPVTEGRVAVRSLAWVRDRLRRGLDDSYASALRDTVGSARIRASMAPLGTSTKIYPDLTMGVVPGQERILEFYRALGFTFAQDLGGRAPYGKGYLTLD
jgi:hypothetical protein